MENKKHLVAFLDILGFKKLIDEHFSGKKTQSLALLKIAMKEAEQYAITYSKKHLKQYKIKFSFKQFSDCVCISMPFKPDYTPLENFGAFINVIRQYQLILLDHHILIRGGVSIGGHFENSNIIFSEGLVKSYKLESQNAIYPRIIIDKDLLDLIKNSLIEKPEEYKIFNQFYGKVLIKDWDDEVFLSPFGMMSYLKDIADEFGESEFKKIFDDFSSTNKLENEFLKDITNNIDIDEEAVIIKPMLLNIERYLSKNETEKPEVLLKYKWLRQFIIWTLTPNESQIKFTKYFNNY